MFYHEANRPKFISFKRAGGFKRDANYRPLQIETQNRNGWRRPSSAVFLWVATEGSVGPIAGLAGDSIGNSLGHNGCKIPACYQISAREWKEPPGGIGVVAPTIQLNGQVYTASDLEVRVQPTASAVTYGMRVPSLDLELDWRFAIEGNELVFELTKVSEGGSFRLRTLDFPYHYLVRVPAADGKGEAYRGEYQRQEWSDPYSNLLWQSTAHFMKISEADGEEYPKDANWAAAWVSDGGPGVAATISDNIPYWKLKTQVLGGEGPGTDFAMWLGTYYYRIGGDVQPLLQSRMAVLTEDRNHDGAVDWMEAATVASRPDADTGRYLRTEDFHLHRLHRLGEAGQRAAGGLRSADCFIRRNPGHCAHRRQGDGQCQTAGDACWMAVHRSRHRLPGVESGERTSRRSRGIAKAGKDAAAYNANIEYHINLNDAYPDSPLFDPSVLQFNREGKPYVWSHQFEGAPPDYRISNTKQFRSGYFQRRIQSFMDTVPVSEGIRLDTFRNCDTSFGPGEDIGFVSETVYGGKILDWFTEHGIVPLTEGPVDGYYGKTEGVQHRFVISDPFQLMMMQGKLYGGGKSSEVRTALGWSMNLGYSVRDATELGGMHLTKFTEAEIADMYYLGNLTQSYLLKKNLIWLGTEKVGEKQVEKDGKKVTAPREQLHCSL